MLLQVLAVVVIGGSVALALFFVRGSRMAGSSARWARIVEDEARTLQAVAARIGGRYEAARGVDAWGREVPVAGSVTGIGETRWARLDYVTASLPGESVSFLPRVSLDLPVGVRWLVRPTAGPFVRDPRLIATVNVPGKILGNTTRMYAREGRSPKTFQRAFGVAQETTPESARALLWSVGERSSAMTFSDRGVEVILLPGDIAGTSPSWFAPQREGGYDVEDLAALVAQVCALGAALSVADPVLHARR